MTTSSRLALRWFQVRTRDVLALILVCAVAAAWYSDRSLLREEVDRANRLAAQHRQRAEVSAQEAEANRKMADQRDAAMDELVELEDLLGAAIGEAQPREQELRALRSEVGTLRRWRDTATKGVPRVRVDNPLIVGLVSDVHLSDRVVEICLGSDDGLTKGATLDVMRIEGDTVTPAPIGQIRIFRVEKTYALGTILDEQRRIQKDDKVRIMLD
jgi:hypothetical protein